MRGDGLYKRPKSPYWYFKRSENGRWREVSTKTAVYKQAKRVRRKSLNDQDEGRLPDGEIARWPFERVAKQYLNVATIRLRPSTLRKEGFFLVRPIELFGSLACEKITATHIQELQTAMKKDGLLNSYINLVTGSVARVLRFVKVWRRIQDDVARLPERKAPAARVLTQEQKVCLFEVAVSNPDWIAAYTAALISANTTMRGCDMKALRWSDVDLFERTVSVPDSKSDAGVRRIPLNDDALLAIRILWGRAEEMQAAESSHYVFPACEHNHFDPTKAQKSWRSAWCSLRKVAGLPWLRFHDLRHQCVTELLEEGAPDQAVMAIAGHVSKRMLDHYSHIRMEAKRKAVQSLKPIVSGEPKQTSSLRPN